MNARKGFSCGNLLFAGVAFLFLSIMTGGAGLGGLLGWIIGVSITLSVMKRR